MPSNSPGSEQPQIVIEGLEIKDVTLCVTQAPPKEAEAAKTRWGAFWVKTDSFLKTALGTALLALFCTTLLGNWASSWFTAAAREADERDQTLKLTETNRRALIGTFTSVVASRRTSLGLVASAIQLDAPASELQGRWDRYQQDYRAYDVGDFTYKADLRNFLGRRGSKPFEAILDHYISAGFRHADDCLTRAYRTYSTGKEHATEAKAILANCSKDSSIVRPWTLSSEIDLLQGCFATYDNELIDAIYLQNQVDRSSSDGWWTSMVRSVDHEWRQATGKEKCTQDGDWQCKLDIQQRMVMGVLRDSCGALSDYRHKAKASGVSKPSPPLVEELPDSAQ